MSGKIYDEDRINDEDLEDEELNEDVDDETDKDENEGVRNARRAQARADKKPSRHRTKNTEVGEDDGRMDRSEQSKEAALAQVKQESKALNDDR